MAAKKSSTKKTAKRTTTKTAAKKPAKKKLSQLDAAAKVLQTAKEPMNCKAMVEAMAKKKLWQSPAGRTPDTTLYASILREIANKGKHAQFKKTGRGLFALNAK